VLKRDAVREGHRDIKQMGRREGEREWEKREEEAAETTIRAFELTRAPKGSCMKASRNFS
jgi:hypothetical protein